MDTPPQALRVNGFNVLVQWQGFRPSASGCVPLSMAASRLSEMNTIGYESPPASSTSTGESHRTLGRAQTL